MSQAILQSVAHTSQHSGGGFSARKTIDQTKGHHELVNVGGFWQKARHAEDGHHIHYDYSISAKVTPATTALTSANIFDFEIGALPGFFLHDNHSVYIEWNCTESGGSNSITPTFVEAFLEETNAVEWLLDGSTIAVFPREHVLLEPLMTLSEKEYESYSAMLNHNQQLAPNSVEAIAASGTQTYYLRIPTIFPDDGFWLGALANSTLTIRFRTPSTAVSTGSGTLNLSSVRLKLQTIAIPPDEIHHLSSVWARRSWKFLDSRLNRPSSITTTSTGDSPLVDLKQLKDFEAFLLVTLARASRSVTNTALYDLNAPSNEATILVRDKSNVNVFTSSGSKYGFQRYIDNMKIFGEAILNITQPFIFQTIDPELQQALHGHISHGRFKFTGDENLLIQGYGSATALFFDSIAFGFRRIALDMGKMRIVG
jgi:uncharacterized membrane protein